jgi:hypothetical protein
MLPARSSGLRSSASSHQRGRQVDGHDVGAAAGGLDRQRAGAAARVEHTTPGEVVRQPRQQRIAHGVAAGAHCGPDSADRASEVSFAQASAAVRSK